MPKEAKPRYVAIEDIASDMGILESDLVRILRPLAPPTLRDHRGRVTVPASCVEEVSGSDEYLEARSRALFAETESRCEDRQRFDVSLRDRRSQLLTQYISWISELEAIHRRYLAAANKTGTESSAMAGYLLLSRAIALLKALHACLEQGHWYAGSFLRDIDETLDLAQYFAIIGNGEDGARVLREWFRKNIAPQHAESREAISKSMASLVQGVDSSNHLDLMRELYRKKSKWTHPTFAAIREITEYASDGKLKVTAIDYGPCTYERKLYELTEFFRSSIWSTFQTLFLCFHFGFGLERKDSILLERYEKKFLELQERRE